MTEIPAHLLARAQRAREEATGRVELPEHLLARAEQRRRALVPEEDQRDALACIDVAIDNLTEALRLARVLDRDHVLYQAWLVARAASLDLGGEPRQEGL